MAEVPSALEEGGGGGVAFGFGHRYPAGGLALTPALRNAPPRAPRERGGRPSPRSGCVPKGGLPLPRALAHDHRAPAPRRAGLEGSGGGVVGVLPPLDAGAVRYTHGMAGCS